MIRQPLREYRYLIREIFIWVLTVNAKLAFFLILHICSNPLYLFLYHLVKLREYLFNLSAPDLVEVEVNVIKKIIAEVFGHITCITSCNHGDASKFSRVFVSIKVKHSCGYWDESLVQDVAIVQNLREVIILREICLKHFLLVLTEKEEVLFLCHLPLK